MNQYDRYRESQALRMINERLKDRAERRQYAEILRGSIKFQAYALERALHNWLHLKTAHNDNFSRKNVKLTP